LGTNATAGAEGNGNLAAVVGNPGNNPGLPAISLAPNTTGTQGAEAAAIGNFNRAFTVGNGGLAVAAGGDTADPLTSVGNNTAISSGNASSYAGVPFAAPFGNSPNNQFALAGPGKIATNAVNPWDGFPHRRRC
jgi:hypothetical protein